VTPAPAWKDAAEVEAEAASGSTEGVVAWAVPMGLVLKALVGGFQPSTFSMSPGGSHRTLGEVPGWYVPYL